MVFDKLKKVFSGKEESSDYVEIDLGKETKKAKVIVRTFSLKSYEDITPILNALREGYTIAIIDIKPLKTKDVIELKRALAKIKKTVDALEGSVGGFGDVVIATPQFAEIYKGSQSQSQSQQQSEKEGDLSSY